MWNYRRAINFYRRETFTIYEKLSKFDEKHDDDKKLRHLFKY